MGQILIILSSFLCVTLIFSCKGKNGNLKKGEISILQSGYWIPKEINWGGDSKNSVDTGDVFRVAFFYTLCFDTANKFVLFASTQRHPRNYDDSIVFAGEPIVKVFRGNWNYIDTSLEVSYKILPMSSTTLDTAEKYERIKVLNYSNDTLILLKNVLYERTEKYDKISQQTMEEYKKNY